MSPPLEGIAVRLRRNRVISTVQVPPLRGVRGVFVRGRNTNTPPLPPPSRGELEPLKLNCLLLAWRLCPNPPQGGNSYFGIFIFGNHLSLGANLPIKVMSPELGNLFFDHSLLKKAWNKPLSICQHVVQQKFIWSFLIDEAMWIGIQNYFKWKKNIKAKKYGFVDYEKINRIRLFPNFSCPWKIPKTIMSIINTRTPIH